MEMRHIKTQPTVHRINVRSSLEDIEIEVDSPGSEAGQMTHEFETLSAARLSSASRNSDHMSTIPEQPTLQSDAFSVTTIRLSPVSQRSNVHSTPSINVSDSPKESRQAYREGSPVIYQWWRTVPGLPLVVVFIRRLRFINVLHWFFILMPVLMFFLSLVFHWWRVIRVDRESLKNKKHADELMWNSTITLTRSQVIFWECFVDSPKSFARYTRTHFSFQGQNDNYSFVRPRCHKILSEVRVVHQFHKQADLVNNFRAQKVLCPIVFALSMLSVIFQVIAEFYYKDKMRIWGTAARIFSIILGSSVIVCSIMIDYHLQTDDPGFPVFWPKIVRDVTTVDTWKAGAIEWLLGILFLMCAFFLDARRIMIKILSMRST